MATPVTATKAATPATPPKATQAERFETIEEGFLSYSPHQAVEIPMHAAIINAQPGKTGVRFYYRCIPGQQTANREFEMILSGQPLPPNNWRYITTLQETGGGGPFHLFERRA